MPAHARQEKRSTRSRFANENSPSGRFLRETAERAGRYARDFYDSARGELSQTQRRIRRHPVQAGLLALATGYLLAKLFAVNLTRKD